MMERLNRLFEEKYGCAAEEIVPLTGSASPRLYYRMKTAMASSVGVIGTDRQENEAFVYLAEHFRSKGLPVPQVYAVGEDAMIYIQEDLGGECLFDSYSKAKKSGEGLERVEELLMKTVSLLPKMQIEGAEGLEFSRCHPQKEFSVRSAMFDLDYFKYYFLKPLGIDFHEMKLEDDFEKFACDLVSCGVPGLEGVPTFLYRDFQARNVMIKDESPYFIDFQSGRRGPVYYDVASFIYHARAGYGESVQKKMLDAYLSGLSEYVQVNREDFVSRLKMFRLFRCLQVLGAYGFRGWVEKKANFVVCIPEAVKELRRLVQEQAGDYPYMNSVLEKVVAHERLARTGGSDGRLEVRVCSFSFKKGIPDDPTGNGGGYVFDCRSIHNPGRYEPYKKLTGKDEPVIRFLEDDGEVFSFLEHVYGIVDPHVETYAQRGFTSLMVSFGCTGGQHRSVYCAEHMARHLKEKYPDIVVHLSHREQ
jgi:aminoglycoside/choline kinase family phosphotransferase